VPGGRPVHGPSRPQQPTWRSRPALPHTPAAAHAATAGAPTDVVTALPQLLTQDGSAQRDHATPRDRRGASLLCTSTPHLDTHSRSRRRKPYSAPHEPPLPVSSALSTTGLSAKMCSAAIRIPKPGHSRSGCVLPVVALGQFTSSLLAAWPLPWRPAPPLRWVAAEAAGPGTEGHHPEGLVRRQEPPPRARRAVARVGPSAKPE
jgi:hypothetical protein